MKTKFLFENFDAWFGYPGSFLLHRCTGCGHIFLVGDFTPEMLNDLYTNYYPRSNFDLESYRPYSDRRGILAWLDGDWGLCHRWVPENVRVLDIGCGYCESLGFHKKRGCEVYGVEADENAQKISDRYGFNMDTGLFDPKKYKEDFFDYVTMQQVLEHCLDPLETLRQINTVLKPGGKLLFSVPNLTSISRYCFGKLWVNWHTPYHLNLFSDKSARILLKEAGFEVEFSKSFTVSQHLLGQWAFLFIHGTKEKKSELMNVGGACNNRFTNVIEKRWDVRLYRLLEKIRIHAFLMRFADTIGLGDHRLFLATKNEQKNFNQS